VPRTFLLCTDAEVIGAPFYVMQRVHGTVYRGAAETATLTADRAVGISFELMDTLALLHDVDPAEIGLGDFGRPDGYLDRQLKRWKMQLDSSRSRELAGIDELHGELGRSIPRGNAAIVHGDYRLDNVIVDAADRVAAVLDWEMCTLGDPLADLGLLLVYWDRLSATPRASLPNAIAPGVGFPSGEQIIARYASRRDVDLSRLSWYVAFGFFKLAVIAEGIYYRYQHGQTVGDGFENMGETVAPLVAQGLAELGRA
jgi:aminoglycoside phosphotransferase (APT) family kinase protein